MVSSHFPSTLTCEPVYVQPSDNSVINFLQRIVRNVTGRVLKVGVARMICRVTCVRGQILRSRRKTRNCAVTHCWPEVCPGTLLFVHSDCQCPSDGNQLLPFRRTQHTPLLPATCRVDISSLPHKDMQRERSVSNLRQERGNGTVLYELICTQSTNYLQLLMICNNHRHLHTVTLTAFTFSVKKNAVVCPNNHQKFVTCL